MSTCECCMPKRESVYDRSGIGSSILTDTELDGPHEWIDPMIDKHMGVSDPGARGFVLGLF